MLERAQRVGDVRAQRQLLLELVNALLGHELLALEGLAAQRGDGHVVLELPLPRQLLQPAVGGEPAVVAVPEAPTSADRAMAGNVCWPSMSPST